MKKSNDQQRSSQGILLFVEGQMKNCECIKKMLLATIKGSMQYSDKNISIINISCTLAMISKYGICKRSTNIVYLET